MNRKQLLSLATLTIFVGLSTLAMGKPAKNIKTVKSTSQVYFLTQVGISKLAVKNARFKQNFAMTGRIGVGYLAKYDAKIKYGVEAGLMGYTKYAKKERTYTEKLGGYSCDLLGVTQYKINRKYDAFVKTGLAYMHQNTYEVNKIKTRKYRPELQLGVGYKINKKMEANLIYSAIYGKRDQKNNRKPVTLPLHSVLIGLQYKIV